MAKYRKKPVTIDAVQFFKNKTTPRQIKAELGADPVIIASDGRYLIETLEGLMEITDGDYIIKGVKGEFYPCKPDIFKMTYEGVE